MYTSRITRIALALSCLLALGSAYCVLGLGTSHAETKKSDAPIALHKKTKANKFHWYELSDAQSKNLVTTLKAVPTDQRREVYVLCNATLDCLSLAQDIVLALQEAGWKASVLPPMDTADGLRCTVFWFCALLQKATGIESHVDKDEAEQIILNFGHKGK